MQRHVWPLHPSQVARYNPLMLNDQLLEAFINGFYGFGKYEASYWFIGMEEGGADTAEKIARQLELWDRWGRKELLDVAEYAREMNITRWYGDSPKLQPTWKHLMRVALTAEGRPSDRETMRQYQTTEWGTKRGNVCIVELLPLPAPSISSWLYKDVSKLPYLASRKTYRERVVGSRIAHLRQRIKEYRPKGPSLPYARSNRSLRRVRARAFRVFSSSPIRGLGRPRQGRPAGE